MNEAGDGQDQEEEEGRKEGEEVPSGLRPHRAAHLSSQQTAIIQQFGDECVGVPARSRINRLCTVGRNMMDRLPFTGDQPRPPTGETPGGWLGRDARGRRRHADGVFLRNGCAPHNGDPEERR